MKKLITILLAFSLSLILIVPVSAVDPVLVGETVGQFADLFLGSKNCWLRFYSTDSPSIDACDSSGSFMTQKVDSVVLRALYNQVALNGANIVTNYFSPGQFRWVTRGAYCWIQCRPDFDPRIAYCSNDQGKVLYCDALDGDAYTTSPVAGAPGYYVTARPRGTSGSGYAGDLAIPQANYMTILNSLQSLGGSATYYTALAVVDGETRYYMSCVYPSRLVTYVCNSSGQLYYYVKEPAAGGETGGGTVIEPFDDTEVITAINSVYSAITSLGSRIGTLINSVDTISQNLAVHISNFMSAITSLRDDIDGFRLSMEYTFAEFTQLYPSDASLTLSSGDTLDWNSAYKQDAVSHFESTPTNSPTIYATGINGFSGNAAWVDGVFTLTPSTGTYFPQSIDVGGVSIDMPSHVVSTAVPNPAFILPDGYSQYDSIAANGTQRINLGRSFTYGRKYKMIYSNVVGTGALWGYGFDRCMTISGVNPSASTFGLNARPFKTHSLSDPISLHSWSLCFGTTKYSTSDNSYYVDGVRSVLGQAPGFSTSIPLFLFSYCATPEASYSAHASIHSYSESSSDGVTFYQNLIPCANPSGEVGMYDTVSGTFLGNAGTGSFIAGVEVPALIGEDVIDYYNIVSIYRGGMTGDYYHWYAIDGDGVEHAFAEDACRQLDASFSAYSFNSIDTFTPQEGSYVVTWDDSECGDIIIEYKSMSRFFSWLYRFLGAQQTWLQGMLLPVIQSVDIGGCDHIYSSATTQEPTCTLPGIMTYTCTGCGESYSEIVPAYGHDWLCTDHVATTYASGTDTVEQEGYDVYTCSRCESIYYDYDGTGAPEDLSGSSITELVVKLFSKLGTFAGDLVSALLSSMDKLLTGFDELITSFTEKTEQVVSFGGDYPAWLAGFWGVLPEDLRLALGFGVVVIAIAIIGKKLLFS